MKDAGVDIEGKIFIAENAHIITHKHLEEDGKDTDIGTTKRGNGPAYRDKYARKGLRAKDIEEFQPFLIDLYNLLNESTKVILNFIIMEKSNLMESWLKKNGTNHFCLK